MLAACARPAATSTAVDRPPAPTVEASQSVAPSQPRPEGTPSPAAIRYAVPTVPTAVEERRVTPVAESDRQLEAELQRYFVEFYDARAVARGGKLDAAMTLPLTLGSYQAYTLPLLETQQREVDA